MQKDASYTRKNNGIYWSIYLCLTLFLQDDQMKFMYQQVRQTDYLEALQNFPSPLNNSHILGQMQ